MFSGAIKEASQLWAYKNEHLLVNKYTYIYNYHKTKHN